MKKILTLLLALCAAAHTLRAQTHIPDPNFAAAIRTACPTCITAGDTLTAAAATLTTLNVSNKNISSVEGVQGFVGLVTFKCSYNQLTSLPTLPNSIQELYCSYNQLTVINSLPSSLISLYCASNQLTTLPTFPSNFRVLYCSSNLINSLPVFPPVMYVLDCSYNKLTHIDALPTNSLDQFLCNNNLLDSLPAFPPQMNIIQCGSNRLTFIRPFTLNTTLTTLYLASNRLTALPNLLPNCLEFNCELNRLTSLPNTLPTTITSLDVSDNLQLLSLPQSLPPNLVSLNCTSTLVSTLPTLPNSLTTLNAGGQITNLPPFPSKLRIIYINTVSLTTLPILPDSLLSLTLSGDSSFTTLPDLPNKLQILGINHCPKLLTLPIFPNSLQKLYITILGITNLTNLPYNLQELTINETNIPHENLPQLPPNLKVFQCGGGMNWRNLPNLPNTLLTLRVKPSGAAGGSGLRTSGLPNLRSIPHIPPRLTDLGIQNCSLLSCLGTLPNTLTSLSINASAIYGYVSRINCLPNIPPQVTTTLPICNSANCGPCFVKPIIQGRLYHDRNNNAICDSTELGVPNVLLYDVSGNNAFIAATDSLGYYTGQMDTSAVATFSPEPQAYFATAPTTCTLSTGDIPFLVYPNNDFAYRATSTVDSIRVGLRTCLPRAGFETYIATSYQNKGTTTVGGLLTLHKSDTLEYRGMYPNQPQPDSVSADSVHLYWHFNNLLPFERHNIKLKVYIPNDVTVGTIIKNKLEARLDGTNVGGDETEIGTIVGAHDPNRVTPTPDRYTPDNLAAAKPIEYLIEFQNTGNYKADYVEVIDTISPLLDVRTLRTFYTSHTPMRLHAEIDTSQAGHPAVIHWIFDKIMLPDSTTNEAESHGYIRFTIVPKGPLPLGIRIPNQAHIVFDYNRPIATNISEVEFYQPLSTTNEKPKTIDLRLSPNPAANGETILIFDDPLSSATPFTITNALGQTVSSHILPAGTQQYRLSTQNLPKGIYWLNANGQAWKWVVG